MLKTTPFDAADYLTTAEAPAAYMTAAFETDILLPLIAETPVRVCKI